MTNQERPTIAIAVLLATGCAVPCADDGLGQQACPAQTTANTGSDESTGETAGTEADATADASGSHDGEATSAASVTNTTQSSVGPDTGDEADASSDEADASSDDADASSDEAGASNSSEGPTTLWCRDADGDGFGDPSACTDEPGDDDVPNGDDCNDADAQVFPGAAELEVDLELCTADGDQDGYGDAHPGPGVVAGTDCWDANPSLNPADVMLATVDATLLDSVLASVGTDGELDLVAPFTSLLWPLAITSTSLRADGSLYLNDATTDRLFRASYELLCLGELSLIDIDAVGPSHGLDAVCGLAFVGNGKLYAIEAETDMVVELDPDTGLVVSSVALSIGDDSLDIEGCGAAWDCTEDRLVVANASDGALYEVDATTGVATLLADTAVAAAAAGLEYDVTTRSMVMAGSEHLWSVAIDGSGDVADLGAFDYGLLSGAILVDDLGAVPACDP